MVSKFLQWAQIVVSLERTYSPEQLLRFREGYSIAFPKREGERGLVVISVSKKTQATRRRVALANWKVSVDLFFFASRNLSRWVYKSCDIHFMICYENVKD